VEGRVAYKHIQSAVVLLFITCVVYW